MPRNLIDDPPTDEEIIVVELTGLQVRDFVFALTLNRRLLDRVPEAQDIDNCLTPVTSAIATAWKEG